RAAPARAFGERDGAVDVAVALDDAAEDERTAARDRADDRRRLRHERCGPRGVVANASFEHTCLQILRSVAAPLQGANIRDDAILDAYEPHQFVRAEVVC